MRKQIATVGLAAGLVAGGAGIMAIAVPALSGAQESTTTVPSTQEAPDAPAKADRLAEALQPLIDDGTLTQAQADAVIARLQEALPRGGPGGHGPGFIREGLATAAEALGISEDELRTDLQNGQSIADIAAAKGVDVQTVIDALVAEAKTHLDEKVASGDITQAQADERLSQLTEGVTAMVNGERPPMPEGGPGRHFRGGPDDEDGTTEGSSTTSSYQTSSLRGV